MAEVLGQRSLLGFGVVLAWLLLFHLLVNIWLLCVFTSLLVVLGGWLGSQAVLESNSVLHLERFITLEQVDSSVEEEHHLDQEIHNTVRKIIRDFVTSWYSTVSSESAFETEVEEAMVSMAMELKLRARDVDRKELTQRILDLLGCHLQDYIRAKELVAEQHLRPSASTRESERLWKAYSSLTVPHLAMNSSFVEANYMRGVVDLLLHVLVPMPHLETRTGRFVVGELITCNVLLPLVDRLSDPDWLNLFLIDIFNKTSKPQDIVAAEPPTTSPPPPAVVPEPTQLHQAAPGTYTNSDLPPQRTESDGISVAEMALPELSAYDVIDSEDVDFSQNNTEEDEATRPFLRRFMRGSKSNPFYQEIDSDLESPLADDKQSSMDSLVLIGQEEGLYDKQKECATSVDSNNGADQEDICPSPVEALCPKVVVHAEPNGCGPSSASKTEATNIVGGLQEVEKEASSPAVSQELLLSVENPNELMVTSPLQGCSPMGTFSFEPLSSPEGPVIIQNLRITGTITAKEHRGTGSHPYTLYTIKYETAMGCENPGSMQPISEDPEAVQVACENPSPVQPVAYHMVNRRYSEFLNLQTRLEERNELRKLIKGVKGPKKIFPDMPFGNMDSDKIEARKGLLETFLQNLCAIVEIANSEEMQEFLALNTDARIAFVKKPFIVSRIDKIVVNAIVDTLKTAFPRSEPQSPTEEDSEIDGGKMTGDKKSKSRLKFSSKNTLFMNGSDVRPPVLFSLDQTNTVFKGMSLGGLEAFISEQENLSIRWEAESEISPVLTEFGGSLEESTSEKQIEELDVTVRVSETSLADVALNILCLLMKEQWSWLCTENIQRTIRLLFGTLINRWLDVSVANLTSTGYWIVYLQVIQEAVWPGGALPEVTAPERSTQERDDTKQQALHCLMKILPDLVSDMLGSDKYRLSWQTALDSFQNPHINRHLVYCIFDLLLEVLVPEIPEEDFQRRVLQTLSKNPEKLLA